MKLFILTFFLSLSANADFEVWKQEYAKRAQSRGLNRDFVLKILKDIKVDPEVIKKDKNQVILDPERDFNDFIANWLRSDSARVNEGKAKLVEYKSLLEKVEKKYKVDKEVIIALWGTETLYGKILGDYDLVRSLATLSYDGRRRTFFETQLNATLRLIKEGHVSREQLKGSWAGATGHCQFMPSNIPAYAQDFDGDGKKDIWGTPADIFASIANYLNKNGWKYKKSIGVLAKSSKGKNITPNRYYSRETYNRWGLRELDGSALEGNWKSRRAAEIPLKNSPYILRGSNYIPLQKWNRSSLFAAFNILLMEGFSK